MNEYAPIRFSRATASQSRIIGVVSQVAEKLQQHSAARTHTQTRTSRK